MAKRRATYTISVVAEMYDVHPQTLRTYEREGLLKPSRSHGNTRLYSEADLKRLESILSLTRDLGVNLAGVEVILNMRDKMEVVQSEVQQLVEYVQTRFDVGREFFEGHLSHALVPVPPSKLAPLKSAAAPKGAAKRGND